MKSFSFVLMASFIIFLNTINLQGQNPSAPKPPPLQGIPGQGTSVGANWTLLSNRDNLVFEAKTDACNGNSMLMFKVQNNTGKEVHVFVSISLQTGYRAPRQLLILKVNQTLEIGCHPTVPFLPISLRDTKDLIVSFDYKINKLL